MVTIIAGSRTLGPAHVDEAMKLCPWTVTEVVSGTAHGVDRAGELWAKSNNIPVKLFPADWNSKGRGAGFVRNWEMGNYAEALVAVWDSRSSGTAHMISVAKARNLKLFIWEPRAQLPAQETLKS